ncbi:beta-lactamase family protein [Kroppenstedtia pulmonis]|uniref:Beta-lactamase family protein n=1 Tax=Kroppenstedtia pulmonis TaxID=1380685 RepID=A0A7D4C8C1_9BACL|nr:serine hydrolase domain-containing protein [Kroppenstedtia pulmonis]QKG85416.1 beta-lactamase family protein [Kroppenstedtia pulmonis]
MKSNLSKIAKNTIRVQQPKPSDCWSVALYDQGEEWMGSYTGQDLEEHDSQSLYEIGSITKVFTGLLLAHEVSKGTVKLTDFVHSFFKDQLNAKEGKMTLEHLATHTSGLPRLPIRMTWRLLLPKSFYKTYKQNPYRAYGETELIQDLKTHISDPISETPSYSNFGYALLGYILTIKRKQSFDEAVRDVISSSLGLKETGYSLPAELKARLLQGFDHQGNPVPHWEYNVFAGAGALRSSAGDLLRFLKGNLVPPATLKEAIPLSHQVRVKVSDGLSACLGWQKNENTGWLGHNGETAGFSSFMALHQKKEQAIIVLCNRERGGVEEAAKALAEAL